MSNFNNASLIVTPNSYKAGKLYSIKPTSGAGDLDVVRATSATRVNSAGLIESVGNNIARLDYTNGSCPSILVEPQRTNLLLQSNNFTANNWIKTGSATVTANTVTSPDGTNTADTLQRTTTNGAVFQSGIPVNAGQVYTYSIYLRADTNGTITIGTASGAVFTPINITTSWKRYTFTRTQPTTTVDGLGIYLQTSNSLTNVYAWGAQLEEGSNATSYIPTTTTSVTRNADVISKTGISSLIGQTEGTIYIDANINYTALRSGIFLVIRNQANANNRIQIFFNNNANNNIAFNHSVNGVANIVNSNIVSSGNVKIAIAYKSGQPTIMYLNGVSYSTAGNIGSFTATIDSMYYGVFGDTGSAPYDGLLGYAMLFKTRLTNTELQQLTTL